MNTSISDYSEDKKNAQLVCSSYRVNEYNKSHTDKREKSSEEAKALAKFIKTNTPYFLQIASRWSKNDEYTEQYKIKNLDGKQVDVNDSIMDTYVWISTYMMKQACKYKGNSQFKTYNYSIMNGSWIFNDFVKHKRGNTAYVPKCITALGAKHSAVYTYLKRGNRTVEDMAQELQCSITDIEVFKRDIQSLVFITKKRSFVGGVRLKDQYSEDKDAVEIADSSLTPEVEHEFKIVFEMLVDCFKQLHSKDRRLLRLYWEEGLTNKQMVNEKHLTDQTIYQYMESISLIWDSWIKNNYNDIYESYMLNQSKIKNGMKILIKFFELETA